MDDLNYEVVISTFMRYPEVLGMPFLRHSTLGLWSGFEICLGVVGQLSVELIISA
jgi:hypothetical protein